MRLPGSRQDALADIRRGVRFLDPRFVWRLRQAGAVDRREVRAFLEVLPSMIGRGPSLGTLSRINALALGSKIALHDRHGSLTWGELDRRVNCLARALIERELPRGSLVASLLRNGREAVEVLLATQKLGVADAPLNTQPSGAPVPFVLERGSPRVVIHTSGTTGSPKPASRRLGDTGTHSLMGLLSAIPYRRSDVMMCPAPLFHSFGLLSFSLVALLGATIVLPERFEPEESLALIEERGVTAASFVPVMVRRIVSLPPEARDQHDTSRLRIVLTSGSIMPPELRDRAR